VTLEALRSRRPLVTTTDAGGPLEFVRDGETGLVCEPAPEPIARALARALEDKPLARRLGETGERATRDISWDRVIGTLTEG
jgi:glycosyltransferase involved in cell wall biosynthesis